MKILFKLVFIVTIELVNTILYSQNFEVSNNNDSGKGSLRQAIIDSNEGKDEENIIRIKIPGNLPIILLSDLPLIKKNAAFISENQQIINGNNYYRLFATIKANLSFTNCTLEKGAAIGGGGACGGGMGAGGGIYIDRGKKLYLENVTIKNCKAQGGAVQYSRIYIGGGGASFSSDKESTTERGGGDYPGFSDGTVKFSDDSLLVNGLSLIHI